MGRIIILPDSDDGEVVDALAVSRITYVDFLVEPTNKIRVFVKGEDEHGTVEEKLYRQMEGSYEDFLALVARINGEPVEIQEWWTKQED